MSRLITLEGDTNNELVELEVLELQGSFLNGIDNGDGTETGDFQIENLLVRDSSLAGSNEFWIQFDSSYFDDLELNGFSFKGFKFPKLPKIKIPKIKAPKIKAPKIKIKAPKLPKIKVPKMNFGKPLANIGKGISKGISNIGKGISKGISNIGKTASQFAETLMDMNQPEIPEEPAEEEFPEEEIQDETYEDYPQEEIPEETYEDFPQDEIQEETYEDFPQDEIQDETYEETELNGNIYNRVNNELGFLPMLSSLASGYAQGGNSGAANAGLSALTAVNPAAGMIAQTGLSVLQKNAQIKAAKKAQQNANIKMLASKFLAPKATPLPKKIVVKKQPPKPPQKLKVTTNPSGLVKLGSRVEGAETGDSQNKKFYETPAGMMAIGAGVLSGLYLLNSKKGKR